MTTNLEESTSYRPTRPSSVPYASRFSFAGCQLNYTIHSSTTSSTARQLLLHKPSTLATSFFSFTYTYNISTMIGSTKEYDDVASLNVNCVDTKCRQQDARYACSTGWRSNSTSYIRWQC